MPWQMIVGVMVKSKLELNVRVNIKMAKLLDYLNR